MRITPLLASFVACGLTAMDGPVQPIAFSHKQHAGELKLACKTCHAAPEPSDLMTIPDESKCMTCHATLKSESEDIQKLAKFAADKKHLPWVRVYQLPTFVFWSHKTHLGAGAKCGDCHGETATQERVFVEKPINMANCVECHRSNNAQTHCTFCHEQRN